MNYAPIVMFVYNRADHFKETYSALAACPEAKYSELYIFSDGAKNESSQAAVMRVREAVRDIKDRGDFKSITVKESPENKGLAKSVISGVTEVIEKYGRVIVVEDDCKTSPHFLKYMNNCLDYYEDNKKIGSVTGFSPSMKFPENYKEDVFTAYRSCSWSWATWADRWDGIDWDLKNIGDFYKSTSLIKKLNANGSDRFTRLYRQTKGNGSSWSVRFGAHLIKNDMLTVYPRFSYASNIGCDESGVHSTNEDAKKMLVDLSKAIENPKICDVTLNKTIQKKMKKHYSYGFISDLKKLVATILIVLKERFK